MFERLALQGLADPRLNAIARGDSSPCDQIEPDHEERPRGSYKGLANAGQRVPMGIHEPRHQQEGDAGHEVEHGGADGHPIEVKQRSEGCSREQQRPDQEPWAVAEKEVLEAPPSQQGLAGCADERRHAFALALPRADTVVWKERGVHEQHDPKVLEQEPAESFPKSPAVRVPNDGIEVEALGRQRPQADEERRTNPRQPRHHIRPHPAELEHQRSPCRQDQRDASPGGRNPGEVQHHAEQQATPHEQACRRPQGKRQPREETQRRQGHLRQERGNHRQHDERLAGEEAQPTPDLIEFLAPRDVVAHHQIRRRVGQEELLRGARIPKAHVVHPMIVGSPSLSDLDPFDEFPSPSQALEQLIAGRVFCNGPIPC